MTLPANIRVNIGAPFPSQVKGQGIIAVSKRNGIWTVTTNFAAVVKTPVVPDPANTYSLVWNALTGVLSMIPAVFLNMANMFTATQTINKNASAVLPALTGLTAVPVLRIAGVDATNADIVVQSFGSGIAPAVRYLNSGGTGAAPSATANADNLGVNFAYGYYTAGGPSYKAAAGFVMVATEAFDSTHTGARLDLYGTATGTTGAAPGASVQGGFMVGDFVDPGAGNFSATKAIRSKGPTAGVGYSTGAGGTVAQAASKSTGVVLNTVCGQITMNNANLNAATIVSFVLTNSAIAATDVLILNHISGGTPGSYSLNARCAAGSATIDVRNNTAANLGEAIVIQFAMVKAVNA